MQIITIIGAILVFALLIYQFVALFNSDKDGR